MSNKSKPLSPRAKEVLDYLQAKGSASPREALLDLDINSGSFTRRITELRDAGYKITGEVKSHPVTKRRYNVYTYGAHA
ncbi:helix-turn-helix domain-containing protein [Sphingomonas desiccabilis]|uniref:helix-turn-helix domain-containing protein n=1 Tax=Sphingomonas desiccabilis TaxID=429134 RepID=UPI0013EA07B7|nr:helix-turn-helix domain-containing protein [Sphingomonas desiccabilis]MBB3910117.1 DNA-binding MarR family transcriptional regulator [Sphingomonas desiccabilis]